jgi:hypothetical protein
LRWLADQDLVYRLPTTEHLATLLPDEAALYTDLVEDVLGTAVRLEQERISFSVAEEAVRRHSAEQPAGAGP